MSCRENCPESCSLMHRAVPVASGTALVKTAGQRRRQSTRIASSFSRGSIPDFFLFKGGSVVIRVKIVMANVVR